MNTNEQLIQLFLSPTTADEPNTGYYTFTRETYEQIFKLLKPIVFAGESVFSFDLKTLFLGKDFKLFPLDDLTEEHRYIRQGGGDLYTYIKIQIQAISDPIILIQENLPLYLGNFSNGTVPKNKCVELLMVYPYILKAIFDYCIQTQRIGIRFIISEIRFHVLDFKSFAYYDCCKQLLNKVEKRLIAFEKN